MLTTFYVIAIKDNKKIRKDFYSYTKAREFFDKLEKENYKDIHLKRQ